MGTIRRLVAVCLFAAGSAFAQSADQEVVSVVDAPDPVTPGATLTYTITLTNHGPDPATNGGFNTNMPGEVTYQNTVAPAGFTCSTFGAAVSCTNPSFAVGTAVFTMNVQVLPSLISFPDGSFNITFSPSGTTPDPNNGNNSKSATTSYNTPQINMNIAVADSPEPVTPDNNITYTVDVGNSGPDAAQNATFNIFNSGTLQFQSGTQPTGWSCTFPSVNSAPTFTCQHTGSYASGATSQFLIVVKASKAVLGVSDGSVSTAFSISGTGNETNNANNTETETTGYSTPDTDMAIAATDSPDPVFPDGNITYTITVTNNGPNTATNANMSVVLNNTLLYQSITVPGGWTCPALSPGHGASFTCTAASVAPATPAVFTLVLKAAQSQIGINDTTLNQVFTTSNEWFDTNNSNNQITVQTAYVTPDANLGITASDSPDPVGPDGDITYTVTINNAGPDTATNVNFNVPLNNTLRWQSMVVPVGWSCPSLAVGHGASFTCTAASFANGATSIFTIVLRAGQAQFGITNQTIVQNFNVNAAQSDPNSTNNSVNVSTSYVAPQADLTTTNADSPDPVVSGANITYAQSITNNGPDTANSVVFSEILPSSVGFVSLSWPAGWSCTTPAVGASGTITCNAASLVTAAPANFTLVVKVLALSGTVSITTVPGSSAGDPNNANNNATATTTITGPTSADMSVTKTTGATSAAPGATITYTITLTNNGPHNATGVSMTDVLPASLLFQSINAPVGFVCSNPGVGANGTVSCTGGTVLNGTSAVFTLVTTVAPNAGGSIVNGASVASAQSDGNSGNSSSSASGVTVNAPSADLTIAKTTAATSAVIGSNITYSIALTNNGPDTATTVSMTDPLPSSLLFQSIAPPAGFTCATPAVGASGTITCNGASLASGATATFVLVVRVANTATGTVSNTASGASQTADPNSGNSSSTPPALPVSSSADLSIAKTTSATQAATGSTITYTITVTNGGPSPAANVAVTDTLPAGLQFVSATPSQGSCSGTTTVTCALGTINNGANATITLAALVTATGGTIANTANVTTGTSDPASGNNGTTTPPIPVVAGEAIPTLSEWALIALGAMLAAVAVMRMRA
jgi:large repetitive protein